MDICISTSCLHNWVFYGMWRLVCTMSSNHQVPPVPDNSTVWDATWASLKTPMSQRSCFPPKGLSLVLFVTNWKFLSSIRARFLKYHCVIKLSSNKIKGKFLAPKLMKENLGNVFSKDSAIKFSWLIVVKVQHHRVLSRQKHTETVRSVFVQKALLSTLRFLIFSGISLCGNK